MSVRFSAPVPEPLARSACELFSPRYGRELSLDEGARMAANLLGLVDFCAELLRTPPAPAAPTPSSPPSMRSKPSRRRVPRNPE